ncbi:MAG: hypothetical protein EOR51_11985 [Mesorhizobium sp.]|uniref:hypothetical protein n=1 Tax=Mesorhizobium sp. TaxID=1871066 RepID=UPI000FE49C1F|nr:hypothetical protein [Mesorhizobium sp.]RWK79625.1 MAG: hypothetical protein EOR50_05715 [Mesorhizobium sp.]RWK82400.1 MAG: hypothetical protein EOR51_11985 [Mesorhizobium sp.]RWL08781.1 MAG: hypothetical protein EOR55_03565 [Mesorhizobium sp.]
MNSILNRCASSGGSNSSFASRLALPVDGIAAAADGAVVAWMIVEAVAKAAAAAAAVEAAARPSRRRRRLISGIPSAAARTVMFGIFQTPFLGRKRRLLFLALLLTLLDALDCHVNLFVSHINQKV